MTFKAGDIVRARTSSGEYYGRPQFTKGHEYTVAGEYGGMVSIERDDRGKPNGWAPCNFELVKQDTLTLGSPSIADDLRLKPQARKVLGHLKRGLTISPLEAQNVYAVYRLAASIHEIRGAGYRITTTNKHDASGHKYARYSLAA